MQLTSDAIDYWIIDSGATHHMVPNLNDLIDLIPLVSLTKIHLPTGDQSLISLLVMLNSVLGYL